MDFEAIKAAYLANPTLETVKELAQAHNVSPRSLIGKLSKAGVYQKQKYLSKRGTPPITKLELVSQISAALELDCTGLEKAPKSVLEKLAALLKPAE